MNATKKTIELSEIVATRIVDQQTGYKFNRWTKWQRMAFDRLSAIAARGNEHSPARLACNKLVASARVGSFVPPELREQIETIFDRDFEATTKTTRPRPRA